MKIADIITAERTQVLDNIASKKKALETLSGLLGEGSPYVTENEIFTALVGREKLGSTGIGDGVAIPHGRLKGVEDCVGAMIRLANAVDFGASDDAPVDLLFGLLVPEKSTEEHLQLLRELAEMLSGTDCLAELRAADSNTALHHALIKRTQAEQA